MRGIITQTAIDPNLGPLVAAVNPATGAVVITHSDPDTGAPIYNATSTAQPSLLDGQLFGVDKKLIALGLIAYLFLRK